VQGISAGVLIFTPIFCQTYAFLKGLPGFCRLLAGFLPVVLFEKH